MEIKDFEAEEKLLTVNLYCRYKVKIGFLINVRYQEDVVVSNECTFYQKEFYLNLEEEASSRRSQ